MKDFKTAHNIPESQRVELWYYLTAPYLDTEFGPEEKETHLKILEDHGISRQETKSIRRRISGAMIKNFIVWEWIHLGQWDFLYWRTFLTVKTYWWTMEIALRRKK